jgi:hypothetical protein
MQMLLLVLSTPLEDPMRMGPLSGVDGLGSVWFFFFEVVQRVVLLFRSRTEGE